MNYIKFLFIFICGLIFSSCYQENNYKTPKITNKIDQSKIYNNNYEFYLPDNTRVHTKKLKTLDYCYKSSGIDVADTHFRVNDEFLRKMKEVGVSTIARYYDVPGKESFKGKQALQPQEARLIRSYGFNILAVFQRNNGSTRTFRNWRKRGPADARLSLRLAKLNNQPEGSAVYFGVDANLTRKSAFEGTCVGREKDDPKCNSEVISYFRTIKSEFINSGLRVGVYGSGNTCKLLKEKSLVDYCWISQSLGHEGTRTQLKSGNYEIHQLLWDKKGQCAGRWLNFSRRQDKIVNYGQFK